MSDTPRTDEFLRKQQDELSPNQWQTAFFELRDFARQLERELYAAQAKIEAWDAYAEDLDECKAKIEALTLELTEARDATASHLIDAWVADKGKKIPWAKAIQIVAIITKQPDAERDRLLRMGDDETGKCEMCGRSDSAIDAAKESASKDGAKNG